MGRRGGGAARASPSYDVPRGGSERCTGNVKATDACTTTATHPGTDFCCAPNSYECQSQMALGRRAMSFSRRGEHLQSNKYIDYLLIAEF